MGEFTFCVFEYPQGGRGRLLSGRLKEREKKDSDGFFYRGWIKNDSGVVSDPREQTPVDNVGRHFGFELGLANEKDDGTKAVFRKIEKRHQGTDVEVVLMQRILKPILVAVKLLSPLLLFFGTEDPTFVVLGLDDENTIGGDDNVVDLRAALPVRAGKIEIVKMSIERRVELVQDGTVDDGLTDASLNSR